MAYSIDIKGDIVISGFQNGIGSDPYSGFTDLKNVDVINIPNEASIGFTTKGLVKTPSYSNITATATASNIFTCPGTPFLEQNQAIYIISSSLSGGSQLSTTQVYYMSSVSTGGGSTTFTLTTQYIQSLGTGISTGTSGTFVFSTYNMVLGSRGTITKNYIVENTLAGPTHWIADSNGLVWSDIVTTNGSSGVGGVTATQSWTYTGNVGAMGANADSSCGGNGLVFFQTVNGSGGFDGWLFLWRQGQIDYLKIYSGFAAIVSQTLSWKYSWKSGLTLSTNFGSAPLYSHEAVVTPFSNVVFCDGYTLGLFYQNNVATSFDPTNSSTYSYFGGPSTGYDVLAADDVAQSCGYVGSNLYVGGIKNIVYPWDLKSNNPIFPLINVPEKNIKNIIATKQSIFIFAGNRGRIYISNGSQADLWSKVPDHISGTVRPTFNWGAALFLNNQIYFGVFNGGASPSASNLYGGVWGIDTNTGAIYLANELSDNSYSGYCTALMPMGLGEYAGNGYFAAWCSLGTPPTSSGVDASVSTPYASSQSVVVSDMIPVGTVYKPMTAQQIEFKLSTPLLTGESLQLLMGSSLKDYVNNTFTSVGTVSGTGVELSGNFPITVQSQQWLIVKAILTYSSGSTPSYNRLVQLRVIGDTLKTNIPTQPYALQ